ncbi:MAG TPA: NAD(P)-dependent oxidoreductase, partial [Verrucomicrobiae bacterium]|nr:NAD(P)-dependent oxidoreductase [Verrucomicrobiae bacterium]
MKILFTGASSFTGFWFVKTLAAVGHEIICPVTKNLSDYANTRGQRIEKLKSFCQFIPRTTFGSEDFLNVIRENNFDLLC